MKLLPENTLEIPYFNHQEDKIKLLQEINKILKIYTKSQIDLSRDYLSFFNLISKLFDE